MRIISGQFGGRTLVSPPTDTTRPITDRAKQSLFDALQNCFEGGNVLDCFAGTGSMGLECLSRGAKKAIFVERDRHAMTALRQNIEAFNVQDRSLILNMDAYSCTANREVTDLTIAFIDPPYVHVESGHQRHKVDELIRALAEKSMVDGGIISLRHPAAVSVDPAAMSVKVVRQFTYGDMAITWLTKAP